VIVKSPKEIADTPGVIAHLANILAVEKINVVEMMSSYTETWFIVDEKDALKTVEAMRQEIKRARK
jgi:aspartokinase